MKQKSLLSNLIIGFTSVILIASCSRDVASLQQFSQTQSSFPKTLNLVANHWEQQGGQSVYMNTFNGVMQVGTGSSHVDVYLVTEGGETLLSSGGISFMGGEIWYTNTTTDLIMYYHNFSQQSLPFASLNIKVVFE